MRTLVCLLMVLGLVGTAFGGGGWWFGNVDTNFNNALNYSSYQKPTTGDLVNFDPSGFNADYRVCTLNPGQTGNVGTLASFGQWADATHGGGTFQMNGGTLNVADGIIVGSNSTNGGAVMNFVNGTADCFNANSILEVGRSLGAAGVYSTATWNQWGGHASAQWLDLGYNLLTVASGGVGVVNMYGGIMAGTDPQYPLYIENSSSIINLAGGEIVLANHGGNMPEKGDDTFRHLQDWIAGGQIVGFGGTQPVSMRDDGSNLILYAPEPATMSLLGLGLLGLLRRKAR